MDTIKHNGTTLTQIGYCDGGRIEVFADDFSDALALRSVATGDWLYQVHGDALDWRADLVLADADGSLWTLDEPAMDLPEDERGPLPSIAMICEGTVERWRLNAPLTADEEAQIFALFERLSMARDRLSRAYHHGASQHKGPQDFLAEATEILSDLAQEMNR